ASAPSMLRYGLAGTHQNPSKSERSGPSCPTAGSIVSVSSHTMSIAIPLDCAASSSARGIARCATRSSLRSPISPMRMRLIGRSAVDRELAALRGDGVADALDHAGIRGRIEHVADPAGELDALLFAVAARRHCRCAD